MADQSWTLTPETYRAVDGAVDADGVFAKPYVVASDDGTQDPLLITVGIRIGVRPRHVVAYFGDIVTRTAPGVYTVQRGGGRG